MAVRYMAVMSSAQSGLATDTVKELHDPQLCGLTPFSLIHPYTFVLRRHLPPPHVKCVCE